ncbi:hypothetical protein Tco_1118296, partial [Tanacetum coccineum]
MRDEGRSFIVMKNGNGEKASVIYDNWCGVGILQFFITNRDLYNARRNANMIVKYIVENGSLKIWIHTNTCSFNASMQRSYGLKLNSKWVFAVLARNGMILLTVSLKYTM